MRRLDGPLHAEIGGVPGARRLVFVHGFTQTGRSWHQIVSHFAQRFEVVVVDAPGHGGSAHVRADLRRSADLIASVGEKATYVGYSMGGRMVLHLALAYPHLVEQLVLISATAGISEEDERIDRVRADNSLADVIERDGVAPFLERWMALPMFAGVPKDPADREDRLRNTAEGLASSLRLAGTGTQVPLWERLHEITRPVLVIAGENDEKFVALGRQMAERIGRDGTFVAVPGVGHAVHLENPLQVILQIDGFLARGR